MSSAPLKSPSRPRLADAGSSPSDIMEVTLRLSRAQLRVFEELAMSVRAPPSDVVVALAAEKLGSYPAFAEDFPDRALEGLLWRHTVARREIKASDWLGGRQTTTSD